jgi:Recombination endonuclease VII
MARRPNIEVIVTSEGKTCSNPICDRVGQILPFSEFTPIAGTDRFMSRCKRCRVKSTSKYAKDHKESINARLREWRAKNPKKSSEKAKRYYHTWRLNNPERAKIGHKKGNIKKRFGITVDEYMQILVKQNYKCIICGSEENLGLDHDHKTGMVRKFLCRTCNAALGFLKDDVNLVLNLLNYLKEHKNE